jgi:hypothetical protein
MSDLAYAPWRERIEDVQLKDFEDEFLVMCPQCRKCVQTDHAGGLGCVPCGCRGFVWVSPDDLWLQTRCCGDVLWAYNWRHLAYLKDLIGRKQRRTSSFQPDPKSLARRMPKWITAAKNRDAVLHAIERIIREKG